jgi:hypothetical protein
MQLLFAHINIQQGRVKAKRFKHWEEVVMILLEDLRDFLIG